MAGVSGQRRNGQATRARGGGALKVVGALVALSPLLALLLPSLLLLTLLMTPTLAALVVDQTRQKYLSVTVGLLNFSFALPALASLWREGHTLNAALSLVADPGYWTVALAGGGFGWCLYFGMPAVLAVYYAAKTRARLAELQRRQTALVKNWGEEVAGPGE